MDTLACNSLFYSTLLQRVGFEKYRSPTSGGNSLVKSRRCKKPILIKWRFRIIFYLMTGTISYPFCNLEFTPCECKKGTDWPTAKDRQRRAARHGQAGSWIMFLNYRKSETDVYTDGTLPPLFHDFAVKINYKKRKCHWSY